MAYPFTDQFIHNAIQEIIGAEENARRAEAKKRHDIYRDGGKSFLIEQITREFGQDAIREMRLTPINFLKKIVESLGSVYKRPPQRIAKDAKDQQLVDYYVRKLSLDWLMQKANRYMVLAANTVLYIRPWQDKDGSWCLKAQVTPNYLYSIIPNPMDKCEIDTIIFSAFVESGRITPSNDIGSATGAQSYSKEIGFKTVGDLVASGERETALEAEQYIFWSEKEHVTTNGSGARFTSGEKDEEQFLNPIERLPIVNFARDRDNEPWATQGQDMVDLTIALQLGFSDLTTIAKHQGFSLLTMISEEEPKKLVYGLNRALWLRLPPGGGSTPSVSFVAPNSPLAEYSDMLDRLMKLFLSTNNMDPGSIGGSSKNYTSGFHALISMSDSLQAVEADKPVMMKGELDAWNIIAKWHNWLQETGQLNSELSALGGFSEEFLKEGPQIIYPDVRPLESEDEKIKAIKEMTNLGLITRKQALKKLNPDATEDQLDKLMLEIDAEKQQRVEEARKMIGGPSAEENKTETEETDDEAKAEKEGDEMVMQES